MENYSGDYLYNLQQSGKPAFERRRKMDDCIFCKIARGEIPGLRVYEDEQTLAFMDTAMDVDGHILVIPKAHITNILDCDENILNKVILTVKKVSNHLVDNCGYHGVDLMSANGEAAGQSLPHFHIHIIPRREQDGLGRKGEWPRFPGSTKDIMEVYRKVQFR